MPSKMTVSEFHSAAIVFRSIYAGSFTSSGRTVRHNKEVGGVEGSPHVYDLAVDIVYDDPNLYMIDNGRVDYAKKLGLLLILEKDHDHLQPLDYVNEVKAA